MSKPVVNRNNVVAGLFLIVSIVLAVSIAFILSDIQDKFGAKKTYVLRFPTTVGVAGLQPGAEVTFGGLSVGKVRTINEHQVLDPDTNLQKTVAHDVIVALRADLVLHEDAFADLTLPMLGGVSKINIPSAGFGGYEGGPEDANTVLDEGETLRGRFAPSILTQLGFTTEEAEKIKASIDDVRRITSNVNDSSARFRRMVESLEPEFGKGVDDGRSTLANIRDFTAKLNGEGGWSGRVDSILGSAETAAGKLNPMIDDTHEAIGEAKEIISESKPRVSKILENVEDTTTHVKAESIAKMDELLDKGSLALGSYKDLAQDGRDLIAANRPKIDTTFDSVRDIGVQGKLFVEEIRSQPWRLLKKPSEEDLQREPIYEAARKYAAAVADLRIASEALDAAVAQVAQTGSAQSAEDLGRIANVVEEAYGRYTEAERGLLERLRAPSPTTSP